MNRRSTALAIVALGLPVLGLSGALTGVARADAGTDPHPHHHLLMQGTKTSTASYQVPDVKLVRDDGTQVSLPAALDDGRPVVMNFIYTTCTTICPVTSQTFSQLQSRLGADRAKVHLVSISIDPEQDTPAHLREYAERFHAGPDWQHYTGTTTSSVTVQRAFDVYRGDKMNHTPVALLRAGPGKPWVRIDGFVSADDLFDEYRRLVAGQ